MLIHNDSKFSIQLSDRFFFHIRHYYNNSRSLRPDCSFDHLKETKMLVMLAGSQQKMRLRPSGRDEKLSRKKKRS